MATNKDIIKILEKRLRDIKNSQDNLLFISNKECAHEFDNLYSLYIGQEIILKYVLGLLNGLIED